MLLGRPWATAAVSIAHSLARNQAVPARAARCPASARPPFLPRAREHRMTTTSKRPDGAFGPAAVPFAEVGDRCPQSRRRSTRAAGPTWPTVPDDRLRAAVAKRLFTGVVHRLAMQVALPDGAVLGGGRAGDPGHGAGAPRRVLPPARCGWADRLRRGLHGGRLGCRRPHRPADRLRPRHGDADPAAAAASARPRRAAPAPAAPRDDDGEQAQHRSPLRPVERPLRAIPRPVDDVLIGALRGAAG